MNQKIVAEIVQAPEFIDSNELLDFSKIQALISEGYLVKEVLNTHVTSDKMPFSVTVTVLLQKS